MARASRSTSPAASTPQQVKYALAWMERKGTARDRANLTRFGIVAPKAFGVSMANLKVLAKELGRSHVLAQGLWATGWYEARSLAAFVDEPASVTPAQMDKWCADFDNWAICDTLCFHLFDRTPHAYEKVAAWKDKRGEFQKRAAFALLASLAGHDKTAADAPFLDGLRFIEAAAGDDRNFVKKAVNWALRRIATRNARLHAASVDASRRLADSSEPSARWIGKDALRELLKKKPSRA